MFQGKTDLEFYKKVTPPFFYAFYRILHVYIAIYYTYYTLCTHDRRERHIYVHTYTHTRAHVHAHTLANLKHKVAN